MGNDLKAENLTISVKNNGCDKNCPYCISKMTGHNKYNKFLVERNLAKVKRIAHLAEVTNVLITGKGEPMMSPEEVFSMIREFNKLPVELQTNGIILNDNLHLVDQLRDAGLDVIAISIDNLATFDNYCELFEKINELGLISRVTLNITNNIPKDFDKILNLCKYYGIRQLTLRNIVAPTGKIQSNKVKAWILDNTSERAYRELIDEVKKTLGRRGHPLRKLKSGMEIWDIDDISFTFSDYCIQESSNGNDIRSLIFMDDGHLYTTWNSKASIIF